MKRRKHRTYTAKIKRPGGTAEIRVNCVAGQCRAVFKTNIPGLSAAHLHSSVKGKPGPILHWLGTSRAWANGVAQNTPISNYPCCNNSRCTLAAPRGTRRIAKKITKTFKLGQKKCRKCHPLDGNLSKMFLVVHGTNYKTAKGCTRSRKKNGIDVVGAAKLKQVRGSQ
jgi:hypothetical protein